MKSTPFAPAYRCRRSSSDLRIVFSWLTLVGFSLFAGPILLADVSRESPLKPRSDSQSYEPGWSFELLPKGFQKNPMLNMTVVTEFTAYGRTVPQASSQHPLYFVSHDGGFQPRGWSVAGENTPSRKHLAQVLHDTLAQQGFLLADTTAHQPDLALFYSWGSHNAPDLEFSLMFPAPSRRYFLERAALVGGKSFVRELNKEESPGGLWSIFSFAGREKTRQFLYDQASRDVHYVVVSAYAFDELTRNDRRLLWRTTMTVESIGLSMAKTLEPLVLTAGPYVGHEVPATALRRRVKIGTVELGPVRIIDDDVVASVIP